MLNKKEKGQIIRYCLYPMIAVRALAIPFILAPITLLMEAIDDLVFHNSRTSLTGIYTMLFLGGVCMVIMCYCSLAPKLGMHGKRWKAILSKKTKDGNEFGISDHADSMMSDLETPVHLYKPEKYVGHTAGTFENVLGRMQAIPETVAEAYGVTIPNIKKYMVLFTLLPIIILISVYIPQYIRAGQELQERISFTSEQMRSLTEALDPVCEYVSARGPEKDISDYGYNVTGYLRMGNRDEDVVESYVYISLDEDGFITDIRYRSEIDLSATLEENLSRIEKEFEILNEPLRTLQLSCSAPGILGEHALSAEFREAFLSGSFTEEVYIPAEVDGLKIFSVYHPVAETGSDSYMEPNIYLMVEGKK